ncbi:hypothetical protein C8J57DRAFT_1524321 [Mycena rebaudengoi]|nr:hypothetical protein C8J57DRAFT_1533477 [Mycena rebaudengoi]KAJ7245604.1 hypothetical protein C8J57DRAFT_1524321 [Mycena rebaudengoi]
MAQIGEMTEEAPRKWTKAEIYSGDWKPVLDVLEEARLAAEENLFQIIEEAKCESDNGSMPPLTSSSQCAADDTTENLSWTRAEREAKNKEIAVWMAGFGKEKNVTIQLHSASMAHKGKKPIPAARKKAPPPELKKTPAEAALDEQHIRDAITAVLASEFRPSGHPCLSLQAAAKRFSVPPSTLTARYNGRQTRAVSHEDHQKLNPPQELVMKEWARVMGHRGVPLTFTAIAEYASYIVGSDVPVTWVGLPPVTVATVPRHPSTGCRARSVSHFYSTSTPRSRYGFAVWFWSRKDTWVF